MNIKDYMYDKNEFGMNYRVFYPDEYKDLPLIVFLHGAGERGTDMSVLYRWGMPKMINEGIEIPAVVLAPQCPEGVVWDNITEKLKALIDSVVNEYNIKSDRISITGSSMGGFGTWMMAQNYPEFFAAAAPVCGGGMSWRCDRLKNVPILAVHGTDDTTVPIVYSRLLTDCVNKCGGNAELIELEGGGHCDGADYAYYQTKLTDWLLNKRKN